MTSEGRTESGAGLLLTWCGRDGEQVLLLALLMLPLLRTASQLFSSMAASAGGPYVPGTLSAAFVTCPNQTVAKEIASYEWKGKIEEDSEVLLMIKTRSSRASALAEFVRSVHPYEVAEVIAVPIQQGNPPYLQWVAETVPE
ncbi:protein CutA isoform X3 [Lacerta agilis]|uniref:protein CutA isoform X3 n=1 Tax=Lacerta agilis TaxID=80427 RepID=UPI0014197479|nr:protein CutA isoform X3 [Lacerta agilis]